MLDDVLLPLFLVQHGLISLDQVQAAGGSGDQVHYRLSVGRWAEADHRVYRLVGVPPSWQSRLLAPILSAGPGAMASHHAAAALHGAPGFGRGVPELSIPRGEKFRRPELRIHTSTDLARCEREIVDGIPVTDVARTMLDLARTVGDQRLLRTIEWARRAGETDWPGLITTLAVHARRGRPGVRRLRRLILANAHRAEITDSDLELLALALLREHGLPEPVLHHRVYDAGRFVAEVDLAYPELMIAIELDGSIHLLKDVHERDLPRQNDLILLGWTVLRFTWDRLQRSPDRLIDEVRAARRAALQRIA
jgi:very-short-patch-repair endonuclease